MTILDSRVEWHLVNGNKMLLANHIYGDDMLLRVSRNAAAPYYNRLHYACGQHEWKMTSPARQPGITGRSRVIIEAGR